MIWSDLIITRVLWSALTMIKLLQMTIPFLEIWWRRRRLMCNKEPFPIQLWSLIEVDLRKGLTITFTAWTLFNTGFTVVFTFSQRAGEQMWKVIYREVQISPIIQLMYFSLSQKEPDIRLAWALNFHEDVSGSVFENTFLAPKSGSKRLQVGQRYWTSRRASGSFFDASIYQIIVLKKRALCGDISW